MGHPSELLCILLSYAAPSYILLSYAAPSELCCTLLAKLRPTKRFTLLGYAAPSRGSTPPPHSCAPSMFLKVQGSRCRNTYWDLDVCSLGSGQFGGQKILATSKNPWKSPIMCFARIKNNLLHY